MVFKANKDNEVNEINEVDDVNKINEVDEVENKDIEDVKDYTDPELYQYSNLQQNLKQSSFSTKNGSEFGIRNLLSKLLSKTYQNDKTVNSIIAAKRKGL